MNRPLNIELHNEIWFDKTLRTSQPLFDYSHPTLAFPDDRLTPFTSLSDLHAETNTIPPSPLIDKTDTDILSTPSPLVLSKYLSTSDGLFFIRYTPEDIFRQRWFPVQVNHVEIIILKMNPDTTCDYHVTFLATHANNKHLCNDRARRWP